jgi:exopolysaccharide biosynthesis predicted pyruvyltransferase EpsI
MPEKTDIRQYLRSLPSETVFFYPNPGNAGDSLIAHATFRLFKESGVNYRTIEDPRGFDPAGKWVIYGGGGNLIERYNRAGDLIGRWHGSAKKFILFPHTVSGNEGLLRELAGNTDLMCREEVSFWHVKKFASGANVYLMDDLAFSLDVRTLLLNKPALSLRRRKKAMKLKLLTVLRNTNSKVLNAFRTDFEKTDIVIPPGNLDLSVLFAWGTRDEISASCASYGLLKFMDSFEVVRTNRLHLCIAGALLDKRVEFFPNNYFKCEAVFRFSIRDRFPNVHWMG